MTLLDAGSIFWVARDLGSYTVAGVCALELPSHLGIHFGRTMGVSSLPQQDTTLIIVHCRGIDEPRHSCWRVRAEAQAFSFMSKAEVEVRAMNV